MTASRNPAARLFARPARGNSNAMRLFCFPHAGGAVSFYSGLARKLAPEVECWCVQLPGRGSRLSEAPYFLLSEMVNEISAGIRSAAPKEAFAFYGHSFGGVLAFEVIRELRRQSRPLPGHLFVGAAPPPHDHSCGEPVHELSDASLIDAVTNRYAGIPAPVLAEPEILNLLLPSLRGDLAAFETYAYLPDRPLECPITSFTADRDPIVGLDRSAGWRFHTTGQFENLSLRGDHFFLRTAGESIARHLRSRLVPAGEAAVR